jgi:hypothetical protein
LTTDLRAVDHHADLALMQPTLSSNRQPHVWLQTEYCIPSPRQCLVKKGVGGCKPVVLVEWAAISSGG